MDQEREEIRKRLGLHQEIEPLMVDLLVDSPAGIDAEDLIDATKKYVPGGSGAPHESYYDYCLMKLEKKHIIQRAGEKLCLI